jgi:hypothetical protein
LLVGFVGVAVAGSVHTRDDFSTQHFGAGMAVRSVQVFAIPSGLFIGGLVGTFIRGDTWNEASIRQVPPSGDAGR